MNFALILKIKFLMNCRSTDLSSVNKKLPTPFCTTVALAQSSQQCWWKLSYFERCELCRQPSQLNQLKASHTTSVRWLSSSVTSLCHNTNWKIHIFGFAMHKADSNCKMPSLQKRFFSPIRFFYRFFLC